MRTITIREEPVYTCHGLNPKVKIELFNRELRTALIGQIWTAEDGIDFFETWTMEIRLVYKDINGCLLIETRDMRQSDVTTSIWIQWRDKC